MRWDGRRLDSMRINWFEFRIRIDWRLDYVQEVILRILRSRCLHSCKQWCSTVPKRGTILTGSFQSHYRPDLVPVPVMVCLCRQPISWRRYCSWRNRLRTNSWDWSRARKTNVRTQYESEETRNDEGSEETTMETSSDTCVCRAGGEPPASRRVDVGVRVRVWRR